MSKANIQLTLCLVIVSVYHETILLPFEASTSGDHQLPRDIFEFIQL